MVIRNAAVITRAWVQFVFFLCLFLLNPLPLIADTLEDPCGGPSALLSLSDNGSAANSPCAVPNKQWIVEGSYQPQTLPLSGTQHNLPLADIRMGLPKNTEVGFIFPSYTVQSSRPKSGFTTTGFSMKHEFWYNETWLVSGEAVLIIPGGSDGFGAPGAGSLVTGMANYSISEKYSLLFSLTYVNQTEPNLSGGGRYSYLYPDLVLSYAPNKVINLYAEVYGQSKTAPEQGQGSVIDAGMLYLFRKNIAFSLSIGKHLGGSSLGFRQFANLGVSVQFE